MLYHSIDADSKLCGSVSSIFVIPMPATRVRESETSAVWRWTIKVHPEFKINLTFLHMHVAMTSRCTTLRAMVIDRSHIVHSNMAKGLIGWYCPEFPITSFYSSQNIMHILLRPASQNLMRFYENRYVFENYANVSFIYQIHDNDFYVSTEFPDYQWNGMVRWNLLGYTHYVGESYLRMLYVFSQKLLDADEIDIPYPIKLIAS